MPKKLIIGISVAMVLVGAIVLTVLFVRSRSLTDEPATEGGSFVESGTDQGTAGAGGLGSSNATGGTTTGQGTGTPTPTVPQAGPCGDGVCSEGESWCKPDCGDKDERFRGSVKSEATPTTLKISWATDTPSTGEVKYGLTERYELGTVSATAAAKTQEVLIRSLSPGTNYIVYLRVTEEDGKVHELANMSFELPASQR